MKIALLVLGCLLAAAPTAPEQPLLYVRPDNAAAPIDQYQLSTWTPGARLFIAPLRVNLRDKPGTSGAVIAKVGMGDQVAVVSGETQRKKEDGHVNHWYQVTVESGPVKGKRGWVFGAFLTPYALTADFDQDRADEIATVAFSAGMKILVRVKDGEDHVVEHEMTPAGQGILSRQGGQVTAKLLPADQVGTPLIALESHIEACGDIWDAYLSYTGGKVAEALMLPGVSDPPVSQTNTVKFSRGAAEVEETIVEQDEKGKESKKTTRTAMKFENGVFKKK